MDLNGTLRSFAEFIQNLDCSGQFDEGFFKDSTVLMTCGDRTVILVGEDADKYTEMVSSIYMAVSERRPVSKRAVSGILDDFFRRMLSSGDRTDNPSLAKQVEDEMQGLKNALFEQPKNWEVRLIVDGLASSGLPMNVGQVQFQYLEEAAFSNLQNQVLDAVRNVGVKNSDDAASYLESSLKLLQGKTIGVLSVNAVDGEAAILAARHKLQTTIDAINFFSSREALGGWAFLPGDTMPQREFVLAVCEDGRVTPSFRQAGPIRRIPLDQIARRNGFPRVSDMLGEEVPTDLEERILASIQWAGRAQVEARREEAFLLYAIALESLLLGRDVKTEISHRLAVRCAHLGGGPTMADKKRVVEQILSLYQVRSNIVHSGNFLVSDAEIGLIREYCVLTLLIVIDTEPFRSMGKVKELEQWFQTQLLSGGISPTAAG
jgi:hypothetical protein